MRQDSESTPVLDASIVLFMTDGMTLGAWEEVGMFEREVALYRRLRPHLHSITIISYGGPEELRFQSRLPGIDIVHNSGLNRAEYRRWLVETLPTRWRASTIVKSNQTSGAGTALDTARAGGAHFIARCGYMLSDFAERQDGANSEHAAWARTLEHRVFLQADLCLVTTEAMRCVLLDMGVAVDRACVMPNYVDTERFAPDPPSSRVPFRVCFIGRLEVQKNPFLLVEALRGTGIPLDIIGNGSLRTTLEIAALEAGIPATFHGNLPNDALPAVLNEAGCFVLPSDYEGHPKTLLEAMACGLPVIGTDRPGIREILRNGETGLLVQPDAADLRAAILRLATDPFLRRSLGTAARRQTLETVSLNRVAALELATYERLLSQEKRP